ncbi:MAG: malonyl-CoA decarboxylase family protein [Bdellovibrionales bacterium]
MRKLPDKFRLVSVFGGSKPSPDALARLNAQISTIDEQRRDLVTRRDAMVLALKESISFEQILPDKKYKALHEQLLTNEQVHELPNIEELVAKRIGNHGDNKRCFARVNRDGKPVVTTGIYTALMDISSDEELSYSDIPGNIDTVKELPVEPFQVTDKTKTVAAILYTISNDGKDSWDHGGRPLAREVYASLKSEAEHHGYNLVISTLSPARKFSSWLTKQPGFEGFWDEDNKIAAPAFMDSIQDASSHPELKQMLMRYLLTEMDPVMKFHLGNGAYIGDIKINPDNNKDWLMINYVYPNNEETLAANSDFFKQSQMRMTAPHLMELLGHEPELHTKVGNLPINAL